MNDLITLIDSREDLKKSEIAKELFPGNKHPLLAFNRVLKGESELNASQITRLALILNVSVEEILRPNGWKYQSSKDPNTLKLIRGEFTAVLNTQTWATIVYHNASLFHEQILHGPAISLNEYISYLNKTINPKAPK